jgi:hypothetical protein
MGKLQGLASVRGLDWIQYVGPVAVLLTKEYSHHQAIATKIAGPKFSELVLVFQLALCSALPHELGLHGHSLKKTESDFSLIWVPINASQ